MRGGTAPNTSARRVAGLTGRVSRRRQGFSLLETLLVLVLLVTVAGLVLVNLEGRSSSIKHDDAVGLIVQAASDARVEAMRSGRPIRLIATNRNTEPRPRVRIARVMYDQRDDEDLGADVFPGADASGSRAALGSSDPGDPAGWSDLGDPAGWSAPPEGDPFAEEARFIDIAELPRGVSLVRRTIRPVVPDVRPEPDAAGPTGAGGEPGGPRELDADPGADLFPSSTGAPSWNNAFGAEGPVPDGGVSAAGGASGPIADPAQDFAGDPIQGPAGGPTRTDTITLGVFLPDGTAWGESPILVMTDAEFVSRLTTSRVTGAILVEPMRFADPDEPIGPDDFPDAPGTSRPAAPPFERDPDAGLGAARPGAGT